MRRSMILLLTIVIFSSIVLAAPATPAATGQTTPPKTAPTEFHYTVYTYDTTGSGLTKPVASYKNEQDVPKEYTENSESYTVKLEDGPPCPNCNGQPNNPNGQTSQDIGIAQQINGFMSQQYPSLAGLGGDLLGLVGGDGYKKWKEEVDKAFCDTVILGGQSCWISKICGESPERAGGDGVLVSQHFGNNSMTERFIAHVEGERSQPIYANDTSVSYLYKVTYAIKNPDRDEPNGFLVRFFYEGGSYDWFGEGVYQAFSKGTYVVATGNNALVAYSDKLYTRVCLVFQKTIEVSGQTTRQVCNTIQQAGGATTPYRAANQTVTAGGVAAPLQGGSGF